MLCFAVVPVRSMSVSNDGESSEAEDLSTLPLLGMYIALTPHFLSACT